MTTALEMSQFQSAVYVVPDCPEIFGMHSKLMRDADAIRRIMDAYGNVVISGKLIWERFAPFMVSHAGTDDVDPWHFGDSRPTELHLAARWDQVYKILIDYVMASRKTRQLHKLAECLLRVHDGMPSHQDYMELHTWDPN